jgi:hypothetical protein
VAHFLTVNIDLFFTKMFPKLSHLILSYTGLFEVVFSIDLPCIQAGILCCMCTVLLRVVCGFFSAMLKGRVDCFVS